MKTNMENQKECPCCGCLINGELKDESLLKLVQKCLLKQVQKHF